MLKSLWALLPFLLLMSCNTWQGTKSSRSSNWTWQCGGGDSDDDDHTGTPAPDSGCPPLDLGDGDGP